MEFSELKNTYGAFDTYITVKKAKELGVQIISEQDFLDRFS